MSGIQVTEDAVKQIALAINAKLAEAPKNEDGTPKDPVDQETLQKMIQAEIQLNQELSVGRKSGFFSVEDKSFVHEKDIELMFANINKMDIKGRKAVQETKMLMSTNELKYHEMSGVGERIEDFKKMNDDAHLIATMLYGVAKRQSDHISFLDVYRNTNIYKQIHNRLNGDVELRKALAVATSGSGAEWIPTGFSSQVLTSIELQLRVPALFTSLAMPTNPWKMPVQSGMAVGYKIPESTLDENIKIKASTPGTTNDTMTAVKLAGRLLYSEEINEDSIVAVRDFSVNELSKAIARAHETSIINGDDSTTHQDSNVTDPFDARTSYKGLRYFALNNAGTSKKDFSNADPSDTLLGNVILLSDKYSVNVNDAVWIVGVNTYQKIRTAVTNILTMDKYGPRATVLSGEVAKYQGMSIVVSEYMQKDLNATGVYDGSTTNRSLLLLVYRPGFYVGTRGGVTLSNAQNIETDQMILVGKRRVAFADPYNALAAGNEMAVTGYNVKTV